MYLFYKLDTGDALKPYCYRYFLCILLSSSLINQGSDMVGQVNCENTRDGVEGMTIYINAHNVFVHS